MAPPTRWGIVSAGRVCNDFVAVLNTMPREDHVVVAVAGRGFENAKKFAALHNIPKVYSSYEELARDPDVEVAYIGSLHPDHRDSIKLMLEHGKHVLCEKPLTMNAKQTEEVIRLAAEKRLFLMEGVWSRFLPMYKELHRELESGSIGDPLYIHVTAGYDMRHLVRVFQKSLGGSVMLTLGIYCLNLITRVFDEDMPRKVVAVGDVIEGEGVDQACAVSMEFSNGRLANFASSSVLKLPTTAEIVGTKGTIKLGFPFWCPTEMETPSGKRTATFPALPVPSYYVNISGLRYEADEVRRCILAGLLESPDMPHKDSRTLAVLMDEILRQIGVDYEGL